MPHHSASAWGALLTRLDTARVSVVGQVCYHGVNIAILLLSPEAVPCDIGHRLV